MLDALYNYNRLCGIWPEQNRIEDVLKLTINIGIVMYVLIGIILYMLHVMSDPVANITTITDSLYSAQCCSNFCFNYIGCIVLRKTSMKFFKNVCNFELFGAPSTLKKVDAHLNRNVKILVAYCFAASVSVNIYYLVTYYSWMKKHEEAYEIHHCSYACCTYYPYNYNSGISLVFHTALSAYGFILLCFTGILYICASYCGIEYMVVKIEHLKDMVSEVLIIDDPYRTLQGLKLCIRYHIHIISLADELNECYSIISTPAIFFYSATLGICFFSMTEKYTTKALLVIVGYILAAFILGVCGQKLADTSESLGFSAYSMEWYDADLSIRQYILFIITRSQKPLTYQAGSFGAFSLPVFMNIIRGAYTYMTMQSNMK
ncbi:putative odorant receptor [Trypoxylus dichotomus]